MNNSKQKYKTILDNNYQLEKYLPKKRTIREFYVEEHRKQIDDYMIKSIKYNKKSIKNIQKQINMLKEKLNNIQRNSKQKFLTQKIKKNLTKNINTDRDHTIRYGSTQKFVYYNCKGVQNQRKSSNIRKQFVRNKQSNKSSSLSSKMSDSNFSVESCKTTLKQNGKNSKFGPNSKILLNKKISQLKKQAKLDVQEEMKIKKQVLKKIKSKTNPKMNAQKNNYKNTQKSNREAQNYHQLINLLADTKKVIEGSQNNNEIIQKKQQQIKNQITQQKQKQKQNLSISIQNGINYFNSQQNLRETIKSNKQLIDTANFNSQNATQHKYNNNNNNYFSKTQLLSQSNLLDSQNKLNHHSNKQIDTNHKNNSPQQHLQIEAQSAPTYKLFDAFQKEMSQKIEVTQQQFLRQKLRYYQFEFDQLVRQQLLSSDAKQGEIIKNGIRNVLCSINDIKDKLLDKK